MRAFNSDAIALSSPSGRLSKAARKRAEERIRVQLFGTEGLQIPDCPQPSEREADLRQAARLREFATLHPRKYIKEAERLEEKWR